MYPHPHPRRTATINLSELVLFLCDFGIPGPSLPMHEHASAPSNKHWQHSVNLMARMLDLNLNKDATIIRLEHAIPALLIL
jgi:hypothetical protein